MQVATDAIVINSVKYGDTSLIVKCYTREEGVKSYLLQGILNKKKGKINKSQFFPLSIIHINASHNTKGSLNRIAEAKIIQPFQSLHIDVKKQSIVFFISEFLSSVLREEEGENDVLFDFLKNAIIWLDYHNQVANFHLKILLELTKPLGFYPDENNKKKMNYFDLLEGKYVTNQGINIIEGDQLKLFNKVLGIKFDVLDKTLFSRNQRTIILDILLKYYTLHMVSFRKPKSLDVLSKVLE